MRKTIPFEQATDEQIQECARYEGLDEVGDPGYLLDAIESDRLDPADRKVMIDILRERGYTCVNITDPGWIVPDET